MLYLHEHEYLNTPSVLDDITPILDLSARHRPQTATLYSSATKIERAGRDSTSVDNSTTLLHGEEYCRPLDLRNFPEKPKCVIYRDIDGPGQSKILAKFCVRWCEFDSAAGS